MTLLIYLINLGILCEIRNSYTGYIPMAIIGLIVWLMHISTKAR